MLQSLLFLQVQVRRPKSLTKTTGNTTFETCLHIPTFAQQNKMRSITPLLALLSAVSSAIVIEPPPSSSSPDSSSSGVASSAAAACTTTITSTMKFGCIITEGAHTATSTIDCGGCAMTTEAVPILNGLLGHGPVCVGGRTTRKDRGSTETVMACATGAAISSSAYL